MKKFQSSVICYIIDAREKTLELIHSFWSCTGKIGTFQANKHEYIYVLLPTPSAGQKGVPQVIKSWNFSRKPPTRTF